MQSVFITGAADGIGLLTARRFADLGWFVGLYDINEDAINTLLEEEQFNNAIGCHCDVTDNASIKNALEHFNAGSGGRMDALVNNAGVLSAGNFEDVDVKAHEAIIDVNIKGLTNLAQYAFPYLRDTHDSVLVNICSASSIHGIPLLAVYSASKFFVNGLSEALSIEWANHGIRIVSIKPGFVKTKMIDAMPTQLTDSFGVDLEPDDVAAAVIEALDKPSHSQILGRNPSVFGYVTKFMSNKMRRKFTAYITGF